jgi:3-hydroxybutyryl-CoA dehydrogenase
MQKGVNYPLGPFAWARRVGVSTIEQVLLQIGRHYGEDRYRVSPRITRRALSGSALDG